MTFAHAAAHDAQPLTQPERAPLPLGTPALVALQRTAGNQAAGRALGRSEAFAQATSGQPVEVPRRRAMETAFGTGFGDVRTYLGGRRPAAEAGLDALGAHAAARGTQIAFRDASPADELVAHELAHVQQPRGAQGVACDSGPGSDAEHAARAAGVAIAAGPWATIDLLEQPEAGAAHLLGTLAWTPPERPTPPLPGPGGYRFDVAYER